MRITQLTGCIVLLCSAQVGFADTLSVEKWGTDSGTCGANTDPCASIQQAIDNASNNDKIEVGPGTYTENIDIGKEGLKIRSVAGRYATTITAFDDTDDVVDVNASKVQIGKKGQGFTVSGATGSTRSGVFITSASYEKIKIEGNLFTGNDTGATAQGSKQQIRYNRFVDNETGLLCGFDGCDDSAIEDNEVMNSALSGIIGTFNDSSILRNLTADNDSGLFLGGSSANNQIEDNVIKGNALQGLVNNGQTGGTFKGNISVSNAFGFWLADALGVLVPTVVENNLAVDNTGDGFILENMNALTFSGNSAISNDQDGIDLPPGDITFVQFKNNNTTNSGDCGIENDSGSVLSYTKHFFGDPAGPNPPGSNDGVCGSDAATGSFATKTNSIKVKNAAKL